MQITSKYLVTAVVVVIAIVLALVRYSDYLANPWTRNGQVRAEVIQLTPRVSGPIVSLPITDNQLVKAGDLLFEIDPRTFAANHDQARARYDQTGDNYLAKEKQVKAAESQVVISRRAVDQAQSSINQLDATISKNKSELERQQDMLPKKATSIKAVERAEANYKVSLEQRKGAVAGLAKARAGLLKAEADLAEARASVGAPGDANASIREARAAVRQAELNLEFTRVVAPVDGYVTNLNLRLGGHAVANQPALALVDVNSFWVDAYFKETAIAEMQHGDPAVVTLMTYPGQPLEGSVDSLGWGIAQQDGSTGFELLPNVSPTFEWIRLAQRVPVRIVLDEVPEDVTLRVGTTGSVLVKTGTGDGGQ
jgi:multidrug resistance efflux pump